MKKLALVLCAAFLLTMCVGCGQTATTLLLAADIVSEQVENAAEEAAAESAKAEAVERVEQAIEAELNSMASPVQADDFCEEFTAKANAAGFEVTELSSIQLDTYQTVRAFGIEAAGTSLSPHVQHGESGGVTRVSLTTERSDYGNTDFAVLSLYAYKSLGLPEVDADTFYSQYNLFSDGDIAEFDTVENWSLAFFTAIDIITFSASFEAPETE